MVNSYNSSMSQPAPQTATPRIDRAERTRQRILDAAGLCFASSGFARTTVEAIASRAGVSKGIVYHHYRGKEQLLERVLERTLQEWADVASLELALARGGSVLEAIAHVHRQSLAFARGNPLVGSLFQLDSDVLLNLADSQAVRESVQRHRASLVEAMRLGLERGELRSGLDPERAADVVRIHYMGMIDHVFNPEWVDVTDELVETGLQILFGGLASEGARAEGAGR